jgi:putative protein-disulfide isomerase
MELLYVHDPMCSWCWGYKPTFDRLVKQLPDEVKLVILMGGLAPDNDQPMPLEMQQNLKNIWVRIEQQLGTQFNYDFWTQCQPVRTTYSACRAVIAAGKQGKYLEMIEAIQHAYYLRAMEPHTQKTHLILAEELDLNVSQFHADLVSDGVDQEFAAQRHYCRQIGANSYPTLLVRDDNMQVHPVAFSYTDEHVTLNDLVRLNHEL